MTGTLVMSCPLCGRALTVADRGVDERFHCQTCYATSTEAQRGWLPVSPLPPRQKGAATGLTRVMDRDPWFSYNAKGEPITRERTCECGQRFVQRQLSQRFLEIVERWSPRAIQLVTDGIPGLFVPVHCLPCERQDLAFTARRDEVRRRDSLDQRPEAAD